ncbi:hypothetical protein ABZ408_37445 [Streptomyces tibetensis]|uniref:hypothetical protein n=1 Tax=Streptomyces tibetensis TaxID=2382123 RepID=UPI0033D7742B
MARSHPLPEIQIAMSVEGSPAVDAGNAHAFVRFVLWSALKVFATGKAKQDVRITIRIVARLLLLMLEELSTTPSVPARAALSAALAARNAAIEGDSETVDAFSRTWLGLSRPEAWREAVEIALLGDWTETLGRGLATDAYISDLLHRHAGSEHRALQPLWERRVRGKRTVLLGQPLGADLTVQDLLAQRHTPEDAALAEELADSRLLAVLRGLAPDEAALARAWAAGGDSWAQAALEAGLPTAYGERVRRKLKRLGSRHTARTAATGTEAAAS